MNELEKLKTELKQLNLEYAKIKEIPAEKRGEFGREMNAKKTALLEKIHQAEMAELDAEVEPIDITAPCAPNEEIPEVYPVSEGSKHPLMTELDRVVEISQLMGFDVMEARQLDD